MRSYIIVCEAGDRSCHYWISAASLSLYTTQSAVNACGQRDGGREGKGDLRRKGRAKTEMERGVEVEMERKGQGEGR